MNLRTLLAAVVLVLAGSTAAFAASAEKGKAAYVKYGCWQCHGYVGQGGIAGPKLAPNPMPLPAFSAFTRLTNGPMPPYQRAVLPEEDLINIHAYLESLPKPADYKSIPLLNQ